jgi:hypothetical protein
LVLSQSRIAVACRENRRCGLQELQLGSQTWSERSVSGEPEKYSAAHGSLHVPVWRVRDCIAGRWRGSQPLSIEARINGHGATVDLRRAKTILSRAQPYVADPLRPPCKTNYGDEMMFRPTPSVLAQVRLHFAIGAVALTFLAANTDTQAQGLVQGVQEGAQAGNKAAGPVGGVLGGAIGGVVGVFTGVLGAGKTQSAPPPQQPAGSGTKQVGPGKAAKAAKGERPTKQAAVLTQDGPPPLTAEQIVTNSDNNIERIKKELQLTPEQERNWAAFNSAMHSLGHNGADRLNLRVARAKRDPPDDIVEQMRNEAQFLDDRAVDQRSVADAAEPLYASLNDKQKQIFIDEMVRLSHERGLD